MKYPTIQEHWQGIVDKEKDVLFRVVGALWKMAGNIETKTLEIENENFKITLERK